METRKIFENIDVKNRYELALRKELYSLFIDTDLEHQVKCLKGELDELLRGIENNDKENINEEVGDIIMNTIQLLQSLLKKGIIDEEVLKVCGSNQKKKIYKRIPFIRKNYRPNSFEEEHNLFLKNKSGK